jgi:hypothetical protein
MHEWGKHGSYSGSLLTFRGLYHASSSSGPGPALRRRLRDRRRPTRRSAPRPAAGGAQGARRASRRPAGCSSATSAVAEPCTPRAPRCACAPRPQESAASALNSPEPSFFYSMHDNMCAMLSFRTARTNNPAPPSLQACAASGDCDDITSTDITSTVGAAVASVAQPAPAGRPATGARPWYKRAKLFLALAANSADRA